jgi:hypothetical protein
MGVDHLLYHCPPKRNYISAISVKLILNFEPLNGPLFEANGILAEKMQKIDIFGSG